MCFVCCGLLLLCVARLGVYALCVFVCPLSDLLCGVVWSVFCVFVLVRV